MEHTVSKRIAVRIDEVVAQGAERLKSPEAENFARFVNVLFDNAHAEDVSELTAKEMYGAALGLWKLSATRPRGVPKVRVYNPTFEEFGWESSHTVVEVINDDMPFLVDSITNRLTSAGHGIHQLMHPIMAMARDEDGVRTRFPAPEAKTPRESLMHIQIDRIGPDAPREALAEAIRAVLNDVAAAVADWRPTVERLKDASRELVRTAPGAKEEIAEVGAFLDWLANDHSTLLGARDYAVSGKGANRALEPIAASGLGVMRDPAYMVLKDADGNLVETSPEVNAFLANPAPILIVKANRRASVHRPVHMDLIALKRYGPDGTVTGERRFIGLFTSAAYSLSPANIPYLRRKVARMVERSGFAPNGHDGKTLMNVLSMFPRDELFQASEDELFQTSLGILHLEMRPRTRIFLRHDPFDRFVSALLFVPRETYSSSLRVRIGQMIVEAFDGRLSSFYPFYGDGPMAQVHYIIATRPGAVPEVDLDALQERIAQLARSWSDDLRTALTEKLGEEAGIAAGGRYAEAFSSAYTESFSAQAALADVEKCEEIIRGASLALKFYRRLEDAEQTARIKLYHAGAPIPLSDCLPVLEHMGFRVIEEHPYEISPAGADSIWMHDFLMISRNEASIDLAALRAKLEEAYLAAWTGAVEDDRFNRLTLLAGLTARETAMLRAYARYLRQTGLSFSEAYVQDTLAAHPDIATKLVRLFQVMFDPAAGESGKGAAKTVDRDIAADAVDASIEAALEGVSSLDEDRILRRYANAIRVTLRTNVYREDAGGDAGPAFAFKIDSRAVADLPRPRPYREIWVYSPQVEGVHLRFGPIARGGLRWSDRREDFRTEVLGLVKAQQVKNAVIVPVGAKGGFYPKQLPANGTREEVFEAGRGAYRVFVSALLDITDNLDGVTVIPPRGVIRRDGDDPYLVVAADKGTATFSDTANAIAEHYGFWLSDAFASGGSHGYDHKGMGITARGGWEAVKRHFRELGTDIQAQPFTVIGCGDMSGDVFGNGMLLSPRIRLIAAFDHRDIFFDPDPDMAKSLAERKRLFEMPRSSWQNYDAKLISRGGGVFSRSAKAIELTRELQAFTRIKKAKATPAEVINAILKAKADLLWFGGIGSYVKASTETHADTGDRANDAIRVDANQLAVRVIGEGANLGMTQRARIEFNARGGKINTDAVDNSAGVDCSDHEVNIKIALSQVVGGGDMTVKQRNALLVEMTSEVTELVLATNYRQTLALSLAEARAVSRLGDHARFIATLEAAGKLDRAVEQLPGKAGLAERAAKGRGLTRPELAVLLAYAKITLFDKLVASDAPDDPHMRNLLLDYMPKPIATRFAPALDSHRLKREIVSTVLSNAMINEGGVTFAHRMRQESGADTAHLARAFVAAREIFKMPALIMAVNALDNMVSAKTQTEMHLQITDALNRQVANLIDRSDADASADAMIATYSAPVAAVSKTLEASLSDFAKRSLATHAAELEKAGVPAKIARATAGLPFMSNALHIADAAAATGRKPADVSEVWHALGATLGLDWLRAAVGGLALSDHWDRLALARLAADLQAQHGAMTQSALASDLSGKAAVTKWVAEHSAPVKRAKTLMAEAKAEGALSLSRVSVIVSGMRQLS